MEQAYHACSIFFLYCLCLLFRACENICNRSKCLRFSVLECGGIDIKRCTCLRMSENALHGLYINARANEQTCVQMPERVQINFWQIVLLANLCQPCKRSCAVHLVSVPCCEKSVSVVPLIAQLETL